MGGAFGKGVIEAFMKFVQNISQHLKGLSIDDYDFDPFQGGSLTAEYVINTYQAIHKSKLTLMN